jgi:hypothetical protein
MFYKPMNIGLGKIGKSYFYLENKYGVDMITVHIKNPNLHPIVIIFVEKKAMFLQNVFSLGKMYKMQPSINSKLKYKLNWI